VASSRRKKDIPGLEFAWLVQQEKTQSRFLFRFTESVKPSFLFLKNILEDSGQDSRLNFVIWCVKPRDVICQRSIDLAERERER
jgi:hypothetical protein